MLIVIVTKATTHAKPVRYDAIFEPVRTVKGKTIGWATVEGLRFPVIVDSRYDRVYTVSDWQAPAASFAENLADPVELAEQISCGQGKFVTPVGNVTDAVKDFL